MERPTLMERPRPLRLRDHCPAALLIVSLAAGLMAWTSGCEQGSDEYRSISLSDAARIDEARQEAGASENVAEDQSPRSLSVVQTAAQHVVEAIRQSQQESSEVATSVLTEGNTDRPAVDMSAFAGNPRIPATGRASLPGMSKTGTAEILAGIAGRTAAEIANGGPIIRTIKLLVPEQSFAVEGPEDALRVSYDDLDLLKVLNMDPVGVDAAEHFPDWLKDLDGKRIRIRGFMYPTFQEQDLSGFLLARDNQICCFGRSAKIYDLFPVRMRAGETTDYIQARPFDVVGVFHIAPDVDGDTLWQLYEIDDAIVIDH